MNKRTESKRQANIQTERLNTKSRLRVISLQPSSNAHFAFITEAPDPQRQSDDAPTRLIYTLPIPFGGYCLPESDASFLSIPK